VLAVFGVAIGLIDANYDFVSDVSPAALSVS